MNGRPDPDDDWTDYVHTGPGTLAGRYMRSFWHPVYRAEDLPAGRTKPIRIMSEDFTLYRGELSPSPLAGEGRDGGPAPPPQSSPAEGGGGKAHLVAFRCAHRGTQLSTGWVEGDDLRCFYHGWKYDSSGQCVEQPAEPEPFCQKVRIRSYPTEEYLGLIFAYLGEGQAPPMPRYPDFEREDVIPQIEVYHARPCSFFNVLEKHVDYSRTEFVHRRSGMGIPQVTAEESEWGITIYGRRPGGELRINQFGMPNLMHNLKPRQTDEETGWRDDISWRVPIDDTHHSSFNVKLVHLQGEAAERYIEKRERWRARAAGNEADLAQEVLAGRLRIEDLKGRDDITITAVQDHVYQVGQGAIPERDEDHLGSADVGVMLLRDIWRRELRGLAEGRPPKEWARTENVMATSTEPIAVSGTLA